MAKIDNPLIIKKGADNTCIFEFTLASDVTSTATVATVPAEVLTHRSDSEMFCSIMLLGSYETTLGYHLSLIGNKILGGTEGAYGANIKATSEPAIGFARSYYPIANDDTISSGYAAIRQNGNFVIRGHSSVPFSAGTYRVVLSW